MVIQSTKSCIVPDKCGTMHFRNKVMAYGVLRFILGCPNQADPRNKEYQSKHTVNYE